ncbi:MAG: type II CAAX endopeptidase family protein [Nannocystaceae bacterium]
MSFRAGIDVPGMAIARIAARFYLAVALAGFVWHAVAQDSNDVWRRAPEQAWPELLIGPCYGLLLGLGIVQVFRALEWHTDWLPKLHQEFRAILGRPSFLQATIIAGASALGEEIFFRGAMLDAWGLTISSLAFALVHIPRRRSQFAWTISAGILGFVLGELTLLTGNLGAAVTAHFVINLLNISYITRRAPRRVTGTG